MRVDVGFRKKIQYLNCLMLQPNESENDAPRQ